MVSPEFLHIDAHEIAQCGGLLKNGKEQFAAQVGINDQADLAEFDTDVGAQTAGCDFFEQVVDFLGGLAGFVG